MPDFQKTLENSFQYYKMVCVSKVQSSTRSHTITIGRGIYKSAVRVFESGRTFSEKGTIILQDVLYVFPPYPYTQEAKPSSQTFMSHVIPSCYFHSTSSPILSSSLQFQALKAFTSMQWEKNKHLLLT